MHTHTHTLHGAIPEPTGVEKGYACPKGCEARNLFIFIVLVMERKIRQQPAELPRFTELSNNDNNSAQRSGGF